MAHRVERFDPLLPEPVARDIVRLCRDFGEYGMYSEEGLNDGIGEGLPQRFDAAYNYVRTGGRRATVEALDVAIARTNYFRETYAYGEDVYAPGIEPFLHHEAFLDGARRIHGRPVIEPAIVYANLLIPGQELATHTDVPEFRGASRKALPQWLLVVMHHSGLFDAWRMPIATAVSWFHDCGGGAFHFYPEGPDGPPATHPVRFNTCLELDTDSVFHGVDRVDERGPLPALRPGMKLVVADDGWWSVRDGATEVARYRWEDLRFSVSWKAYCFTDERERRTWRTHADDLTLDAILERLETDLRTRGRLDGPRPARRELATLLVDEYVRFPRVPRP
jgi:hypothetical protein